VAEFVSKLTKELRRLAANHPGPDDPAIADCLGRLSALGEPGIEPICSVSHDPQIGPAAINRLALMLHPQPDPSPNAINAMPTPVANLSPASLGALGRLTPLLKQLAAVDDPDKASLRANGMNLLIALSQRLSAANMALLEIISADRVPAQFHAAISGAVIDSDPGMRRKIDAMVAKGSSNARAINELVSCPSRFGHPFRCRTGGASVRNAGIDADR